jgi:hypothetical protein
VFVFRLAALYVWLQAALFATQFQLILWASDKGPNLLGIAVTILLQTLFGTALWFASPGLARLTLSEPSGPGVTRATAIGGLALRLAGLYAIDVALQRVWDLATSPTRGIAWVGFAMTAVLGSALVLGGGKIAARLFGRSEPEPQLAHEIQAAAFSVLGLVLIVRVLPILMSIVAHAQWFEDGNIVHISESPPGPGVAAVVLRLALGVGLFLGGGALSRFWRWSHTAGTVGRGANPEHPRP